MRRIVAAAALVAAMFLAGCTASGGTGSGASGSPTSTASGSAAATSAAAAGSDQRVCDDAKKVIGDSTTRFATEIAKIAQSGNSQEAQAQAVPAVHTLLADWATGLRTEAGKATNPELKTALTDFAAGLEKVRSQITTAADLTRLENLRTPEIDAAADKLQRICG